MDKLHALIERGKKLAQRQYPEGLVVHYLLPTGVVLEVIYR